MSRSRAVTAIRVAALVAGIAASGCHANPNSAPQIRIGLLAIVEGVPRESSGQPSINGAELAVEHANEQGGIEIGGVRHDVVLVVRGYQDRPDSATSVGRAIVNQDRIDALVGPQFSRHAIPVAVVAENARLPMLSPMSSNPATTNGKRFVFRLAFLDEVQGEAMARFAREELGATKAAVLYDVSTAYGRSLARVFRESFVEGGGDVVAFESYARDEPLDYAEQLMQVRASDPDVLYLPNDTERVVAQVQQAREQKVDAVFLGGDTWDMERFRLMPECQGAYFAHQWHHEMETAEAEAFVEQYRGSHGKIPKVTAAMTYDAVGIILKAIEVAGSKEPDALQESLRHIAYEGATGSIRFEGSPDPRRDVFISQIRDGRSRLFRIISP